MPPPPKPPRTKFLETLPTAAETAAVRVKRTVAAEPRKFKQTQIDSSTLNKARPEVGAKERNNVNKKRPHRAVVLNQAQHARDGSIRFSYGCYCLRRNLFFTSAGRRESELLDLSKLMRRADRRCGHTHSVFAPFPLRKKRAIVYARLSLTR